MYLKKHRSPFLLFFIILLIFSFSACQNETSQKENSTNTGDMTSSVVMQFPLSPEQFDDTEIEILENVTKKELSQITEKDLLSVERINIIGNHVTTNAYRFSFSKNGYSFRDTLYPYENDWGSSLSVLRYFTNLKYLGIFFCDSLSDVSFLENLTNLEELSVVMSHVTDFTAVEKLDKLTSLEIRCSPVEKIAVSTSNTLKFVTIGNGKISDLAPFSQLTNLENFNISFNQVPLINTDCIASMEKLTILQIIAPDFDMSFLGVMQAPFLYDLVLGGHENMDLSNIGNVSNHLTMFHLKNADSTDLTPLDVLPTDCYIEIVKSENCIHGKRTTDGAENYSYSDASHDMFDWYYEK